MAPIEKKRKSNPSNEDFLRSKKSLDGADRPTKKLRPDEREGKTSTTRILQVPRITKVREEEVAFPRGGASVLTPLEHKQIQIEATRDVLFEQQGAKSSVLDAGGDEASSLAKRKSKNIGKSKKVPASAEPQEESVKIEGLSYKRIVPGSLILGQVSQINDFDIALSLPNNLTGYVPITSISDFITNKIENLVEDDSKEDPDDNESHDVELRKLFKIGQYLRAVVVSTSENSGPDNRAKRRIELSLRPQQSNGNLTTQNVVAHSTLMASVSSVEDHGLIMDLGIQDSGMKGFMSTKELGAISLSEIQEGAVLLCFVTGLSSNGKIVKLSADLQKMSNQKKLSYLSEAPTIDAFQPGTAAEVLVSDISSRGISGKIMGMMDVTADLMHSGAGAIGKDLEKKYKIGSKIKVRVICNFPSADPPKLGVSLLDHVLSLNPQQTSKHGERQNPLDVLPLSSIIEEVIVRKVEPGVGLFVDVGLKGVMGFVHISRVKDGKIESLSEATGPYKTGTSHRGRMVGYNSLDGVYLVSLEKSVLEQPFLRIEDLKIGEVVKGKVEKIVVNASGVGGILVELAEGITGFVPETHLADVQLLHPEKKFKEGASVTARVLSTDLSKRQIRLTLKKTLVNSEAVPFLSYDQITTGMQSPGTIINLLPAGAVVQFYGDIRGYLPVSEMSEAYIQDPSQHFKVGQVVNVHVLNIDPDNKKLTVSCKDPSSFGLAQQAALKKLRIGDIVSGSVTEKSSDDVSLELAGLGLRAIIPVGHLTDQSESKNLSSLKKIRVGQKLMDLAVLEKLDAKHLVVLTNKPTLVNAAKERTLLRSFEDVKENKIVRGFVKNITYTAVFVQFAGGLTGLLPKNKLPEEATLLPDFGLRKSQSIEAKVIATDAAQKKFLLSMVDVASSSIPSHPSTTASVSINQSALSPIDETITSFDDLTVGKLTKAKVISIKDTQLNVKLADNIQGRIDVSQIFDTWDEISDRKKPLKSFANKDNTLSVRVLGVHDARSHRFLPITHRSGKNPVFELSAKPSDLAITPKEPLTLDKIELGSKWIAFVNNIQEDWVWVNLSPNVRGRIQKLNLSDDVSQLEDVESNFPIGSAVRVHVVGVDVSNNRLNLSARSTSETSAELTLDTISKGMVIPGKVTRVDESQIIVQLNAGLSGVVHLPDMADDFTEAETSKYSKNDIVRVCVVAADISNKSIRLSTRPSRVLDSSLAVLDREISSVADVKVNDLVRGFVSNIADKGVLVNLGGSVRAHVRVSDLSDSYIKDWKSSLQIDQLVTGKVTSVDKNLGHVSLSLKASVIDKNYVPPVTYDAIRVGQIVTGKIRKVEDFGVFIVIDNSMNVSGLCHQSEMAEKRVHDVKKLYEEGDLVKAIVLRMDPEKKRISFGMKASYFDEDIESAQDSDEEMDDQGAKLRDSSDDEVNSKYDSSGDDDEGGVEIDLEGIEDLTTQQIQPESSDEEMQDVEGNTTAKLDEVGFDWSANILDENDSQSDLESEAGGEGEKTKSKKRRRTEIKIDRTGDLDANGPQSSSDFERLLLGQPDDSSLWIRYLAFQIQLGELSKARAIAERAIKTINIREETEKLNVWIALLNLEVEYGSDETVDEVFKRACQYNDAQEIHESLISIYIKSGKHSKADDLFQALVKKFSQSSKVWENYAQFLYTTHSAPDRARALLSRAMQSLPSSAHLNLTLQFASLEFKSANGSAERGRTLFEGVLSTFPKRIDIWSQLLDLELKQDDKEIIRGVFESVVKVKGLKPKGAKDWFKRWKAWEDENGDKKSQERVDAKAAEWVKAAAAKKNGSDGA